MKKDSLSLKDYFKWRNQRFAVEAILGEVVYGDVTVIVKKYEFKKFPDDTNYIGYCVVKRGDKYLIDLWAAESDMFLRKLSADDYSAITGVKGPE